jgi:uncharacterized repeat protein (TIGR03806 family)
MKKALILSLFSIVLFFHCSKTNDTAPDYLVQPYQKLSEYGFFTGSLASLTPSTKIIPYDLNTPLFSDYASKERFIYIPDGKTISYHADSAFHFPVGTIIGKTFYFSNDLRNPSLGRKIMETRLLIKKADKWDVASYIWRDDQSEADFSVVGNTTTVAWTHTNGSTHTVDYYIPNKNDCKGCHNISAKFIPIGPKARNLNKNYTYPNGSTQNQLEYWTAQGVLTGAPATATIPRLPVWDNPSTGTLELRARAYIDINCGHCHNPHGPSNNSGLFLNWENQDQRALGVCKPPVAAGTGAGTLRYDIVPGLPASSIMVYRMNSTQIDVAMPELARSLIHTEGLQLIRDWIAAMPATPCL